MLFLSEKYACKLIKSLWVELTTVFLTALKLQTSVDKTRHVWHAIRTCFFVECPRLYVTDGIFVITALGYL